MKESRGETRKEGADRIMSDVRHKENPVIAQDRTPSASKPNGMPNPVKGLPLSLYPIVKEH
jgi:hypothetical protein